MIVVRLRRNIYADATRRDRGRLIDRIARGATIALHSLSYLAALIRGQRVPHRGFCARITRGVLTITRLKTCGFPMAPGILSWNPSRVYEEAMHGYERNRGNG